MKRMMVLVVGLLAVFTLAACDKPENNVRMDINNFELQEMLDSDEEYQFVDVRTATEYNEAHIPGFDINLDYYEFQFDPEMLDVLDRDIPVVLMCRSGNRSVSAAEMLLDEGFDVVYNLEDGINGWTGETE